MRVANAYFIPDSLQDSMDTLVLQSGGIGSSIGAVLGVLVAVYFWYEAGSWVWNKVTSE